jgi:metal-responsive CopG/Arc/MetJ family transcriptional regulator
MVQVSLPEQTAKKLQQVAANRGIDATQLLVQLVEEYLAEQPPLEHQPESPERVEQ